MSRCVPVCVCVMAYIVTGEKKKRENRIDKNVEREREREVKTGGCCWIVYIFKKERETQIEKKINETKKKKRNVKERKNVPRLFKQTFFIISFPGFFFSFSFITTTTTTTKHTHNIWSPPSYSLQRRRSFSTLFLYCTRRSTTVCVCVCDGVGSGLFIANGYDHIRLRRARFSAAAVDSIVQQTGSFFFCERLAIDDRPTPQ